MDTTTAKGAQMDKNILLVLAYFDKAISFKCIEEFDYSLNLILTGGGVFGNRVCLCALDRQTFTNDRAALIFRNDNS